jgi:hypothetical protein
VTNLAQAYIHLKPYPASERKIRSLGRYATRVAIKAAADIYGGGVEVEIQIEEGSLITRITVAGSLLLGAYSAIADYKGFKESVVEMCDDAREFAVDVCGPFIKKAGVAKDDVYRFESRLRTPGKLYSLSKRLERLEHSVNELSPRDVQKELGKLRAQLDTILRDVSPAEKLAIETRLLKTPSLPPPTRWPIPDDVKVAVQKDEEMEQAGWFEDEPPSAETAHKRRILFKQTASVPHQGRKRLNKKQLSAGPNLLP